MLISGIQKFTLLDYPEVPSCIVFVAGCNFRCGYCHNPEFVLPEQLAKLKDSFISEQAFFNFLEQRKGMLEAVVITGGEPTIMGDLPEFIRKIKKMGFLVKLDTNGNNPKMLRSLLDEGVLDYVAMDIKTTPEKYRELVGEGVRPENIRESVKMIMGSGVPYEFRTTMVKELHSPEVLAEMVSLIRGARVWYLQKFRPDQVLDPKFKNYHSFTNQEFEKIKKRFEEEVGEVGWRE